MTKSVGVNERGIKVGQDHHRAKYSDRTIELVRSLKDQGMTYLQIAAKMEMPYWTVSRICRHERRNHLAVRFKEVGQ